VLAWLFMKGLRAPGVDATWTAIGIYIALAALGSYLRTGIEVGTLEARCRVLAPPEPSQDETIFAPPDDLSLPEPEPA
jgi:hypothetical protein